MSCTFRQLSMEICMFMHKNYDFSVTKMTIMDTSMRENIAKKV